MVVWAGLRHRQARYFFGMHWDGAAQRLRGLVPYGVGLALRSLDPDADAEARAWSATPLLEVAGTMDGNFL